MGRDVVASEGGLGTRVVGHKVVDRMGGPWSAILRVILLHVVCGEPSNLGEEEDVLGEGGEKFGWGTTWERCPQVGKGPYPPVDLSFPPAWVALLAEDTDDVTFPQR